MAPLLFFVDDPFGFQEAFVFLADIYRREYSIYSLLSEEQSPHFFPNLTGLP